MTRKSIEDFSLFEEEPSFRPTRKPKQNTRSATRTAGKFAGHVSTISTETSTTSTSSSEASSESTQSEAPSLTSFSDPLSGPTRSRFADKVEAQQVEADQGELELMMAVRNLEPLLHPQTKNQFRHLLEPKMTAELHLRLGNLRRANG